MIVAIFGVSGVGKTFSCNEVAEKLNFKKFCKIKIREIRPEEVNSNDVIIADENLLQTLQKENKIALLINIFGNKYAFFKQDFYSKENMIFEMNYRFLEDIKKIRSDIFTVYIIPNDANRVIQNIKNRNLNIEEEIIRIDEAKNELELIKNESFLKKFDLIVTNTFECFFVDDLIKKIKNEQILRCQ